MVICTTYISEDNFSKFVPNLDTSHCLGMIYYVNFLGGVDR